MEYFLASKCKNVLLSNPLRLHFLLLPPPFNSISAKKCKTTYCDDFIRSPWVEFPFQLNTTSRQAKRCSYPGFNLSCNSRNQTILTLPYSGDFVVYYIDYFLQSLLLKTQMAAFPDGSWTKASLVLALLSTLSFIIIKLHLLQLLQGDDLLACKTGFLP